MTPAPSKQEQKMYRVPARFSMSAMLVFMTLFGLLFGALRFLDAYPVVYLFFASLAMATGITQMRLGNVPRLASAAAGAIFLPLWIFAGVFFTGQSSFQYLAVALLTLPFSVPIGALIGYFSGTLMAGVFLTLDMAETWFAARQARLHPISPNAVEHSRDE